MQNQAPLTTGAIVRSKEYISGGPAACGQVKSDFWQDSAPGYNCGFAVDPRRVDKYSGCGGCSPQACSCGGGCGSPQRDIDDAFDDLCVSRPLDYLYADQLDDKPPLQQTRFSHAYSLRCGVPTQSSENAGCNTYQTSQGDKGLRAALRFHVGP